MIRWTKDWMKVDRAEWEQDGSMYYVAHELADALDRCVAALNGMVGLIQLLAHNDDIPAMTRMSIVNNHRVTEAKATLRAIGLPQKE